MFHQLNSLFHKCLVHILIWFLSATRHASPPDGWLHFSQGDIARGHQKCWFLEVARLRYYVKRLSNFKTTQALYPAMWSSGNTANFVWGGLDNHGIQGNFMIQLLPGGHHSAILDVATDCQFFHSVDWIVRRFNYSRSISLIGAVSTVYFILRIL